MQKMMFCNPASDLKPWVIILYLFGLFFKITYSFPFALVLKKQTLKRYFLFVFVHFMENINRIGKILYFRKNGPKRFFSHIWHISTFDKILKKDKSKLEIKWSWSDLTYLRSGHFYETYCWPNIVGIRILQEITIINYNLFTIIIYNGVKFNFIGEFFGGLYWNNCGKYLHRNTNRMDILVQILFLTTMFFLIKNMYFWGSKEFKTKSYEKYTRNWAHSGIVNSHEKLPYYRKK